jgi:hypothetical protein
LDLLVTSSKKGHIKSAAFNKSTFITVN